MFSLWRNCLSFVFLVSLFSIFLLSCAPKLDIQSEAGRQAIKDATNVALTKGDCQKAIELIEVLYNSEYTDNETRILRASAHGCHAKALFFDVLDNLVTDAVNLVGTGFWNILTQMFQPTSGTSNTVLDSRITSTFLASDALMATIKEGQTIPEGYALHGGSYNPGSIISSQREDEANLYLFMISMATIGTFQSRYGSPDSAGNQTVALPFLLSSTLDGATQDELAACGYAGAVLNMIDGIDATSSIVPSATFGTSLTNVTSLMRNGIGIIPGLGTACLYGCQNLEMDGVTAAGDASCNFSAIECNPCAAGDSNCITCPTELRNRFSCQSSLKAACAAAGVMRWMDLGWQ